MKQGEILVIQVGILLLPVQAEICLGENLLKHIFGENFKPILKWTESTRNP